MPLHVSEDMLASRWAKLQLNLANAVNALADVSRQNDVRRSRLSSSHSGDSCANYSLWLKQQQIKLPKIAAIPGRWMPTLMTLPDPIYLAIAQSTLAN